MTHDIRGKIQCGMTQRLMNHEIQSDKVGLRFKTADLWLQEAVSQLSPIFAANGILLPPVRVSLGWTSAGIRSRRLGECWPRSAVKDEINAIFITTQMKSAVDVLDVLVHELVHAVDDCTHKHGKEFAHIAKKVGLAGPPWRSAGAGSALMSDLTVIAQFLGDLPYSPITKPAPQARDMKSGRVICSKCGYTCRTLSEWNPQGAPLCPKHKEPLIEDWRIAQQYPHSE